MTKQTNGCYTRGAGLLARARVLERDSSNGNYGNGNGGTNFSQFPQALRCAECLL